MSKVALKKDKESGMLTETHPSLKRRISEVTGFKYSEIVLMESSEKWMEGMKAYVTTYVCFQVKGKGFWTNFFDWDRDDAYDEKQRL